MVGELSPALSSRVRRLRGRAGQAAPPVRALRASIPDHRTQLSRLGAQREGTRSSNHDEAAAITRPEELDDDETTKDPLPTRTKKTQFPTRTKKTLRPARPFITPFQRLAPPRFLLRPPSSSCGNVPEGGRSLVPMPHSTNQPMANDLHRPSPHTKRGENRQEDYAGKIRAPPMFLLVFSWRSRDGF